MVAFLFFPLKFVSSLSFSFLFFNNIFNLTVRIAVHLFPTSPPECLTGWNARSLNYHHSCRASLDVHWNLAAVLYCKNIYAKIVGNVKIMPFVDGFNIFDSHSRNLYGMPSASGYCVFTSVEEIQKS